MVDYSLFDSILDAVFVVQGDGTVVYCNDAGATLCQTSVRRMINKLKLSDLLAIDEPDILPFTEKSPGREAPTPSIETEFRLVKGDHTGKVQLAIRPIDGAHWGFFVRDVSLEEALHSKYRSELAQKEEYARNLEKLVEARTAELRAVNQTLRAILNSLGQGFFTFDASGVCGKIYTRACKEILEGVPAERPVWEVLKTKSEKVGEFKKWIDAMFKELLSFDELKVLGPNLFPHSQEKHVVLDYFPIRDDDQKITEIVVVATDKTTEHRAQLELEAERQYASMIIKYIKNKDRFLRYLRSLKSSLDHLLTFPAREMRAEDVAECFRILHTLEGEAGAFSLHEMREGARACQHVIEPFKGQSLNAEARRKFQTSLENLRQVYEKFLNENRDVIQLHAAGDERWIELPLSTVEKFMGDLKKATGQGPVWRQARELFYKEPMEKHLRYFDGLIANAAEKLGKRVHPLVIEGGDTKIFTEAYTNFFSSLVHAFRNAVDHGLEAPEEREWVGKDPAGKIRVEVQRVKGQIQMTIEDDGRGIDPKVIREKLKAKFPDRDFSGQSDEEIIQNVCLPGFSSRDSVGEFSGRGVGLDALRDEVLKLGGSLRLKSKVGQGTRIEIVVPEIDAIEEVVLRSA